jgi:hypothetical protein
LLGPLVLHFILIASALLAGAAFGVAAPAHASPEQFELRSRWSIGQGPFGAGGKLILRQLDHNRVSLMTTLPDLPWLPARQFILREGGALLHWQDPEGARSLLEHDGPLAVLLAELPPTGLGALFTGRGLDSLLTGVNRERSGGWTTLRGRLAGHTAELRLGQCGALALNWRLPEGEYHFNWREGSAGPSLSIHTPQGHKVRIFSRMRSHVRLLEEDWLFLSD